MGSSVRPTLDPKLDVVFKLLFSNERNSDCLISLLTAVLKPAEPIISVEVLDPETPRGTVVDKGAILDLRLRLLDGTQVHVEVQLAPHPGLRERLLFYWARVFSTGLARGGAYTDLRPSVGIFIFDFKELPGERYHSIFRLLEVHDHTRLSGALELHVLELPKLPKGPARADDEPVLRWARFFAAENDDEREQLAMTDPDLRQTKSALEELSDDPRAQHLAFERQIELNSQARYLEIAREQAQAEGRAKGREEGRAKGHEEGRAEGFAQGEARGLRETIELLCQALRVEFTLERRNALEVASVDELRRIVSSLALERVWPSG